MTEEQPSFETKIIFEILNNFGIKVTQKDLRHPNVSVNFDQMRS
jgi:hypothetical protein